MSRPLMSLVVGLAMTGLTSLEAQAQTAQAPAKAMPQAPGKSLPHVGPAPQAPAKAAPQAGYGAPQAGYPAPQAQAQVAPAPQAGYDVLQAPAKTAPAAMFVDYYPDDPRLYRSNRGEPDYLRLDRLDQAVEALDQRVP